MSESVSKGSRAWFTQQQLAGMIDSSHPFISNMKRGLMLPGLAMLMKLANAFEYNVSELVAVLDQYPRRARKVPT